MFSNCIYSILKTVKLIFLRIVFPSVQVEILLQLVHHLTTMSEIWVDKLQSMHMIPHQ